MTSHMEAVLEIFYELEILSGLELWCYGGLRTLLGAQKFTEL